MDLVKTVRYVTYEAAAEALRAGLEKAAELGLNVGIVVTDTLGEVVAAARTDGAGPRTWRGGLMKATVAASMGRTTREFIEGRLKGDEVLWRAMSANPETFLVPGGAPLIFEGKSVGGVGVSGGHYDDDERVANAAAARFAELAGAATTG
ncbi:MAG: heme-binding protein [Acidimicrobiales bacterium]